MKRELILFDLDGTLAENSHRQKYVTDGLKDWETFFAQQEFDLPVLPIVKMFRALNSTDQFDLFVVTARPERYRSVTESWLKRHAVQAQRVVMRQDGDRRPDDVIKREILHELEANGQRPLFVVDDRKSVVQMWRDEGIVCLQCADHNF